MLRGCLEFARFDEDKALTWVDVLLLMLEVA